MSGAPDADCLAAVVRRRARTHAAHDRLAGRRAERAQHCGTRWRSVQPGSATPRRRAGARSAKGLCRLGSCGFSRRHLGIALDCGAARLIGVAVCVKRRRLGSVRPRRGAWLLRDSVRCGRTTRCPGLLRHSAGGLGSDSEYNLSIARTSSISAPILVANSGTAMPLQTSFRHWRRTSTSLSVSARLRSYPGPL